MVKYNFISSIASVYILVVYVNIISSEKLSYLDIDYDPLVNTNNENPIPILGVLEQEVSKATIGKYPDKSFTSYIAASYVKFVEGAGGRVVPIWMGKSRDYYEDILSKINGVLLPGGVSLFNHSAGYADAARHIYEIAGEINDNGTYFPIWGTCLGMEFMVYLTANSTDSRIRCSANHQALPLEFAEGYEKSRLFRNASANIIDIFKNYPVTVHSHNYCFTEETFFEMNLNEIWNITSVNHDFKGLQFISTIEHYKYPFYGVQFHPEKALYEFKPNRNITHLSQAIQASQYFANFLVNEARRNHQKFENTEEETESLIYKYVPVYTGLVGSVFRQQYLFKSEHSSAPKNKIQNNLIIILLSLISVGKLRLLQ